MSVTNGVISTTDVTTRDVGSVLGSGSTNVGTLCKLPNINKWAQFKPVRGGISHYGYTGFYTPKQISGYSVVDYSGVSGGEREPYCLGHFKGYDHNTSAPWTSMVEMGVTYIKPNGTRSLRVRYKASGLDFRKEGYNCVVVTQTAPVGSGEFIVGMKRLDEFVLNGENIIDIIASGKGMVDGSRYTCTFRVGFGTTSASSSSDANSSNTNIYATVGDTKQHFAIDFALTCSATGTTPPTPPELGKIVVTLTGAPSSIINANPSCSLVYESNDQGQRLLKMVGVNWGEDVYIPQADINTFGSGVCTLLLNKNDGSAVSTVATNLRKNAQFSPAFGMYFSNPNQNLISIPFPPVGSTYNYELRWSRS